ncbi:hypothetical protein [Streptosporangium roseum]|uniref:hypothetical protein n=1 Tax=Streptosporangium roseum TaxID=2001 RepID=UPI0012DC7BDE|nr:hypothetical protein [Streptosporangium roseum]
MFPSASAAMSVIHGDLFSPAKAQALWESLPDDHRQDHFDSENMPEDYAQAFRTVKVSQGGQWTSHAVSMRGLPLEMIWEIAWFIHHEVADGHLVNGPRLQATRIGLELATQHGSTAGRAARSVMALSVEAWVQEIRRARMRQGKGEVGTYVEVRSSLVEEGAERRRAHPPSTMFGPECRRSSGVGRRPGV